MKPEDSCNPGYRGWLGHARKPGLIGKHSVKQGVSRYGRCLALRILSILYFYADINAYIYNRMDLLQLALIFIIFYRLLDR
jgi:hypothetical protein